MTLRRITTLWIVYWVALFALTHAPRLPGIRFPARHIDKVAHFGGYAILATLCALHAKMTGRTRTRRWYVTWFVILALYAIVDEILQAPVHRNPDVWDWVADMAGVISVFCVVRFRENRG